MQTCTFVSVLLFMLPFGVPGLKCYKCLNQQTNSLCSREKDLVTCDKSRDTCQTIVTYSHVSEKMFINKKCTKNVSCEIQVNETREDTPCDKSQSSWICTSCCSDDGCNIDGAHSHTMDILLPLILSFIAIKIEVFLT